MEILIAEDLTTDQAHLTAQVYMIFLVDLAHMKVHRGSGHGVYGGGESYSYRTYSRTSEGMSPGYKWGIGTVVIFIVLGRIVVIIDCCYWKHYSTVPTEDKQ
ncbi:unnamed protein product [Lepeophtheirus salmonis]|uniref:(salmon louse) hypothetical protein n=1 Tax=Lepeophtheirus salmonis TaxID=72036 RepID=A0A7R8GZX5_LEPSM|nr:unnamed protein product [Lepeophtheirus salmonis]CAF2773293.1 unnamed protein product [Lepeophtheirus salmonis]